MTRFPYTEGVADYSPRLSRLHRDYLGKTLPSTSPTLKGLWSLAIACLDFGWR